MKPVFRISMLLVLSIALFTSCKKAASKQAKHIPKNAAFVATIDPKSIFDKLSKNEDALNNLIKRLAENDTTFVQGLNEWDELKNSGVSLDEKCYLAVVQKGAALSGNSGTTIVSALGSIKDEAKFEAYLKKKMPSAVSGKEKDYSFVIAPNNSMIAWNKDMFISMMYQKAYNKGMEYDTLTGEYKVAPIKNLDTELKAEMASYFNMKEADAISSIPEFTDLMMEKADATFWSNSSATIENMPLPLPKLKELLKNTYSAGTVNFEEGKIVANGKSYSSKALGDIFKEYAGPTIDLSLIEKFPSDNINGFMVFAFKPEIFNAVVKYLEVGGLVDGFFSKGMGTTYTLQDFLKIFKGDIAVIMSDLAIPAPPAGQDISTAGVPPTAKLLINIPVGDKAEFNKIMNKVAEQGLVVKSGNSFVLNPEMKANMGFKLMADEKNILITSDSLTLAKYIAGTGKAGIKPELLKEMKGKAMGAYINIESILNAIPAKQTADIDSALLIAKQTFKELKATSENYNGKFIEGSLVVTMKNEKENSLNSMVNFFASMAQIYKSQKAKKFSDIEMLPSPEGKY